MQTIYDSKGRPFYLLVTVCMDADYWAYRNPISNAVYSAMQAIPGMGGFTIRGRWTSRHATFPPARIIPVVLISRVTHTPIITLGCHTFTGKNAATLMMWIGPAQIPLVTSVSILPL